MNEEVRFWKQWQRISADPDPFYSIFFLYKKLKLSFLFTYSSQDTN